MAGNKEPKPLYRIIFRNVFLVSVLIIVCGLLCAFFILFQYFLDQIGQGRVDLLKQISYQNNVVRSVTASVTDEMYDEIMRKYDGGMGLEDAILQALDTGEALFHDYGMRTTIDVILPDTGWRYTTGTDDYEPTTQLISSYWYIALLSEPATSRWNMRFLQLDEAESFSISYARALRDASGHTYCVLISNSSQKMIYENYNNLIGGGNRIYIVDQNGTIISHSNPSLIGFSLYHMGDGIHLEEQNGYEIKNIKGDTFLISTVYDPDTGWTIVEELQLLTLLASYRTMLLSVAATLLTAILLALWMSFRTARTISWPLTAMATRMEKSRETGSLEPVMVEARYIEILQLSQRFNRLLERIRQLIAEMKAEEEEKRRIEFDFLQAQINPHFLHNTLLCIKSLVITGRNQDAERMLSAFMTLLRIPITAGKQSHSLREEIEYIRQYVTVMEYRYGEKFPLTVFLDDALLDFQVPRMMLQPLVENAIFYGISAMEGRGQLCITASQVGPRILLTVEDNGSGMTPEQIEHIWDPEKRKRRSLNSIGLRNVLSRIRYMFGPQSAIKIESRPGLGTVICIMIEQSKGEMDHETDDRRR